MNKPYPRFFEEFRFTEIHEEISAVYGPRASVWRAQVKAAGESFDDESRKERLTFALHHLYDIISPSEVCFPQFFPKTQTDWFTILVYRLPTASSTVEVEMVKSRKYSKYTVVCVPIPNNSMKATLRSNH